MSYLFVSQREHLGFSTGLFFNRRPNHNVSRERERENANAFVATSFKSDGSAFELRLGFTPGCGACTKLILEPNTGKLASCQRGRNLAAILVLLTDCFRGTVAFA